MSETANQFRIIGHSQVHQSSIDLEPSVELEKSTSAAQPRMLSTVRAPRPFGYRKPVGEAEEDGTFHPLRRRDDYTPLK